MMESTEEREILALVGTRWKGKGGVRCITRVENVSWIGNGELRCVFYWSRPGMPERPKPTTFGDFMYWLRKADRIDDSISDSDKTQYLIDGGWIQNGRGWWHPPSCLASWPLDQSYLMAKEDERKRLRMSKGEVVSYLRGD
jgi:hypothetical protein